MSVALPCRESWDCSAASGRKDAGRLAAVMDMVSSTPGRGICREHNETLWMTVNREAFQPDTSVSLSRFEWDRRSEGRWG